MSVAPGPDPDKVTLSKTDPPLGAEHDSCDAVGMTGATIIHADLASWLLAKEVVGEQGVAGLLDAAERVCHKLALRLSRWVSAAGSQALMSRALHVARAEFPFLQGVGAGTVPEACFEGLRERAHDVEADEVRKGLSAVLVAQLDLLVAFIGEDLTLRLVGEVWPEMPLLERSHPKSPDGQEAPF